MKDLFDILFTGINILISYVLGTITGFGANIIAYPPLLLIKDIYFLRPMLTIFGFLMSISIFVSTFRHTDKKIFLRVFFIAGVGMIIGYFLYAYLSREILLLVLSAILIYSAVRGILEEFTRIRIVHFSEWLLFLLLCLSGIFQGAISAGGIILAIYLKQKLPEKKIFRSTLAACSIFYTLVVGIQLFIFPPPNTNRPSLEDVIFYAKILPFVLLALLLGHVLATRLPLHPFRKLVSIMLMIGAITTLISTLNILFI